MNVLVILAVMMLLAFVVESLVEYIFGTAMNHISPLQPYKWALMYIALALGEVCAFVYGFDLVYLLGQYLGASIQHTILGMIITGAVIGRGANYLHDLIKSFFIDNPIVSQ